MNLDLVESLWKYFDFTLVLDKDKHLGAITSVGKFIRANDEAFKEKPLPDYAGYVDDRYFKEIQKPE